MQQYLDLVRDVLENGAPEEGATFRSDRTGVGTLSVFGRQMRFDLEQGFPLVTTKKVHLKSIIYELLWMLRGETNINWLNQHKVSIWDEWADESGELGPIYGKLWRNWEGPDGSVDQIANLIENIKRDPYSRRHIVVSFNPGDKPKIAPQGCHTMFQLYVKGDQLSLQFYQRSADLMLGVPFNTAAYAMLAMMIAQVTGLRAKELIHTFGDVHIYSNHIEGAQKQIQREPRPLPQMKINPSKKDIFSFEYEDFELVGYDPHEHIPFKIAV